jgi:DNA-binding GntR family transcriptional regulator
MAVESPSETLVEQLGERIRTAIRKGELAPGERLVVADLASRFGASAGPVREAIRRLAGEGVLESAAHRGASVRSLTSRGVREIFEVRAAIEGCAARLAAENIGRGDYSARLRDVRIRLREAAAEGHPAFSDARQAFHDALYVIAGNSVLRETALRLTFPLYRLYFNGQASAARARDSLIEHEGVIEAILEGDGVRAERLMKAHLRNGADAVCEALEDMDAEAAARPARKTRKKGAA